MPVDTSHVPSTNTAPAEASGTFQSLYDLAKDACTGGPTTTTTAAN